MTRAIWLAAGVVAALACLIAPIDGLSPQAKAVLALLVLMAIWWVSEAIPLAATALLPIVALPLIGIAVGRDARGRLACAADACGDPARLENVRLLTLDDLGAHYANPIVLMYIGGFLLGIALERCGLSQRIAFALVARGGADPKRMVAAFLIAGAALSMWISNTATALILTPLALSVAAGAAVNGQVNARFAAALALAVAYAATIGGLGTPIGTPTNGIALQQLRNEGVDISFGAWMAIGVPAILLLTPIAWLILTRGLQLAPDAARAAQADVQIRLRALGPVSAAERRVAIIFALTAACWCGSTLLADLIGRHALALSPPQRFSEGHLDTIIATLAALALFITPAGGGSPRALLTWDDATALPWGVLLLFGGGLALAAGAELSGLSAWLAGGLSGLSDAPPIVVIAAICLLVIVITEFASNVATISLMGPVLIAIASQNPALAPAAFVAPAAMAASMGFAMPVGSAANAIAYATGVVPQRRMIASGLIMNLAALAVLTLIGVLLAPRVMS